MSTFFFETTSLEHVDVRARVRDVAHLCHQHTTNSVHAGTFVRIYDDDLFCIVADSGVLQSCCASLASGPSVS